MDTLRNLTSSELLSLFAVLLLADFAALWKMASLRGDTHAKWRQRVELTEAALSEKAASELRWLFLRINELLGPTADFDPRKLVADPGKLVSSATRFRRLINTRERLQRRFALLLRLGPIMLGGLLALALGLVLGFGHLLKFLPNDRVLWVALSLSALSSLITIASFVTYIVLQHSLSGAEILSVLEELHD